MEYDDVEKEEAEEEVADEEEEEEEEDDNDHVEDDNDGEVDDDDEATAQKLGPHFVGACAIDLHLNMSQEPLYTENYR